VLIVPGQIRNGQLCIPDSVQLPENIPVVRCTALGPDRLALITPKAKQATVKGVSVTNPSAPAKQAANRSKKSKRTKFVRTSRRVKSSATSSKTTK
jgi:hypothetical protein